MGDKLYCLGLGGWASGSNKVIACVMHGLKLERWGSTIMSENSSNKAEIYGLLAPGN